MLPCLFQIPWDLKHVLWITFKLQSMWKKTSDWGWNCPPEKRNIGHFSYIELKWKSSHRMAAACLQLQLELWRYFLCIENVLRRSQYNIIRSKKLGYSWKCFMLDPPELVYYLDESYPLVAWPIRLRPLPWCPPSQRRRLLPLSPSTTATTSGPSSSPYYRITMFKSLWSHTHMSSSL